MEPSPFYVGWLRDRETPLVRDFVACAEGAAAAAAVAL